MTIKLMLLTFMKHFFPFKDELKKPFEVLIVSYTMLMFVHSSFWYITEKKEYKLLFS